MGTTRHRLILLCQSLYLESKSEAQSYQPVFLLDSIQHDLAQSRAPTVILHQHRPLQRSGISCHLFLPSTRVGPHTSVRSRRPDRRDSPLHYSFS